MLETMLSNTRIIACISILAFTLYFTWGFTKLPGLFYLFSDPKQHKTEIFIAITYLASVFALDYFIPRNLKPSVFIGLLLSLATIPLLLLYNSHNQKYGLGELLFRSQTVPKAIYIEIIEIIVIIAAIFAAFLHWRNIKRKTIHDTINFGGIAINSYLWSAACLAIIFSIILQTVIQLNENRLEIRDRGLWYSTHAIVWENITAYNWSEYRQPPLLIEYKYAFKTDLKLEIAIAPEEKERIDRILQLNLKDRQTF